MERNNRLIFFVLEFYFVNLFCFDFLDIESSFNSGFLEKKRRFFKTLTFRKSQRKKPDFVIYFERCENLKAVERRMVHNLIVIFNF